MYTHKEKNWIKHADFMLLDLLCLQIAFIAAYYIRFPGESFPYVVEMYRNTILVYTIIEIAISAMSDNLKDVLKRGYYVELISVLTLSIMCLILISVYVFSTKSSEQFSRLLVYYTTALFFVLDYASRVLYKKNVVSRLKKGFYKNENARKIFIYTSKIGEKEIVESLENNIFENYEISGISLSDDLGSISHPEKFILPEEASKFICREWIDEVFIYLPGSGNSIDDFMKTCTEMGVTVHLVLDLNSISQEKQMIEDIGGKTVLTVAYNFVSRRQVVIKRMMDIMGGFLGSVLTILIGLVLGPIIYLNSPGSIIFRQERIGMNGKHFYVLKFRSMYPDAEARKKEFLSENRVSDGMMFKLDFDPRIIGNRILSDGTKKTGIGEFIRKTSLDEFPQFFNVLKGDMSLVGTRPPTLDEWEKYEYHHRARLAMKPGITGLWQVSGRSKITDFEEVVKLDTQYITNYRLALDFEILFKTIKVVFERKGAM